jgi:hypothetical protein
MPLILFSSIGYTDQTDILAKGRDYLIDQAFENVKKYCIDFLPGRSLDSTYICRLQIQEDCSRPSEKQDMACEVLKRVADIEKKISSSDKNIAQLEPLPLYSSKPIIEAKDKILEHEGEKLTSLKPVYTQLSVKRGSSASYASKIPESFHDSQLLDSMALILNSFKIRVDCSSDSDCKILEFGKKICGGPVGTFVYAQRGDQNQILQDELAKFNEADGAFIKRWNKGIVGTCDWSGRTEPAKCIDQVCR